MTARLPALPEDILRGVTLITLAAFTISLQDVVFKLSSSEMTLWQIFALRGVLAVPLLMMVLWIRGAHKGIVRAAFGPWPLLRAVFITITFLAFYAAIPFLSLSTVGAANYIAPIFVALLSAYAINEPVGPLGWLGVLLGFAGVIILLQPGSDAFSPWSILPIVGAAFYAFAHIITRVRCKNTPPAALSLSQNVVMMAAGFVATLLLISIEPQGKLFESNPYIFGLWSRVGPTECVILMVLAGFAILISLMLAGAYQAAPPAIVATFEYSYLVFVAIWDIVIFRISPSAVTVSGMILIMIAGLLVLRRGTPKASLRR